MVRNYTAYLLLLCLLPVAGVGGTITDLYQAEAPIESLQPESRRPAIRAALGMVLVKLTGNRYAPAESNLRPLLQRAESYMLEFKLNAEASLLWVRFDEETLTRDLRGLGLAIWGKERPSTLLWLAIKDEAGEQILGLEGNPAYLESIARRTRQRGIDLTYPLLDLEDNAKLQPDDIRQGYMQAVLDASSRYPVESILIGSVEATAPGIWEGQWTGYISGATHNWRTAGDIADIAIEDGIDGMTDLLATNFIQDNAQAQDSVTLTITDIYTIDQYAEALKYLESLSFVSKVLVNNVTVGEVSFKLMAHGGCPAVAQAITLGRKLIPNSTGECSRYRLLP